MERQLKVYDFSQGALSAFNILKSQVRHTAPRYDYDNSLKVVRYRNSTLPLSECFVVRHVCLREIQLNPDILNDRYDQILYDGLIDTHILHQLIKKLD
tara:strand:+ start:300 stop:593 length:294 start_codon:yes stop_codon:yes gene_type:complete